MSQIEPGDSFNSEGYILVLPSVDSDGLPFWASHTPNEPFIPEGVVVRVQPVLFANRAGAESTLRLGSNIGEVRRVRVTVEILD